MARNHYLQLYVKEDSPREAMLDTLTAALGLGESHKDRLAAIDAALSYAVLSLGAGRKGEDVGVEQGHLAPSLHELT